MGHRNIRTRIEEYGEAAKKASFKGLEYLSAPGKENSFHFFNNAEKRCKYTHLDSHGVNWFYAN